MDKADKVDLFRNDGFTADTLMKDVRYKISAALHSAGLTDSAYGNAVLKGLGTNQHKVVNNEQTRGLF